ncbi:MAG: hypothetical protein AB1509_10335 [Chloroflexota bacterium]
MDNSTETFRTDQKDLLFACGMLTVYAVCFIAFVFGSFLWIKEDKKTVMANATATEGAAATQRANMTVTAVARITEQATYEHIDRFDDNSGRWYVGTVNGDYGDFSAYIANGEYVWNIIDAKGYTLGDDFYKGQGIKDFDAYVDIMFSKPPETGGICGGLTFRKSSMGWEDGAYVFAVCSDLNYIVSYYQIGEWTSLMREWVGDLIFPTEWNRIEVHVSGNEFVFYINNHPVFEMQDDRRKSGNLGLFIDMEKGNPAVLRFDNFAVQRR